MHLNSGKGVNGLTCNSVDPISAQPELKHAAVQIRPVNLPWRAVVFGLFPTAEAYSIQVKLRKMLAQFDSAQCVLFGREQEGGMIGVSFQAAHHADPQDCVEEGAALALKTLMEHFKLDEQSSDRVLRYRDPKRGIVRYVRAEERVMAALLTGSIESLASTSWLREYLEQGLEASSLGRSLLLPVSQAPVALKPRSRAICNCFNVTEDTLKQCLSEMSVDSDPEQAMALLQTKTQCGTNCGSCKPEVKQIITHYLESIALA